jgi:hypothetical protein
MIYNKNSCKNMIEQLYIKTKLPTNKFTDTEKSLKIASLKVVF